MGTGYHPHRAATPAVGRSAAVCPPPDAAAGSSMDDTNQQDDCPDQHHHSLHRIVEYAGAEAAESGIQRDGDPKDQQTGFVLDPGSGFQQARAANKLHRDGPDKGHQQADAGNPYHRAALVARLQHIVKGNSIVASRQDRELLAEGSERARSSVPGSSPAVPNPAHIYRRRRGRL